MMTHTNFTYNLFILLHTFLTLFILSFTSPSFTPSIATCNNKYFKYSTSSNFLFRATFYYLPSSYTSLHSSYSPFSFNAAYQTPVPTVLTSILHQQPVPYHLQIANESVPLSIHYLSTSAFNMTQTSNISAFIFLTASSF